MTAYDRVVISGQSVLCGSRCVDWLAFVCPEVCMLPLQSVKVHTASDVTNEDESPLATDKTPFQSTSTVMDQQTESTKKWSSRIEVPIGLAVYILVLVITAFSCG